MTSALVTAREVRVWPAWGQQAPCLCRQHKKQGHPHGQAQGQWAGTHCRASARAVAGGVLSWGWGQGWEGAKSTSTLPGHEAPAGPTGTDHTGWALGIRCLFGPWAMSLSGSIQRDTG